MIKSKGYVFFLLVASLTMLPAASTSLAQSAVTTMTLGPNDMGTVKTAPGITTRISLGEPVKQVICGDPYDPISGRGKFLVESIENEVYIKPVGDKGASNLFIKVGEKKSDQHIYNFDLFIVPVEEANRVINVINSATLAAAASKKAEMEDAKTYKKRTEPPVLDRSRVKSKSDEANKTESLTSGNEPAKRILAMYPSPAFMPVKTGTELTLTNDRKPLTEKDVAEGEPVKRVYPDYPELARILRITGAVDVSIEINKRGKVTKARAISGPEMLRDSAIAAAREWSFAPTTVNGRPAEGSKVLTFNFKLGAEAAAAGQKGAAAPVDRDQELKTALEMVQKALTVDPTNTLLLSSTGWIYFHLGQLEEAERYLSKAADRESKNSEVQERFGDVCFSLSKKAEAEHAWRQALNTAGEIEQKDRLKTKLGWIKP